MWLNDIFWGIRAHFWGDIITFCTKMLGPWRLLDFVYSMCCNRSHKSRRHTQSIYKSFSRTILGVLQPLLVGYKKPVHFHIIQLISKFIQNFQNIMNHLRLLLFFFVLLAPLQLTSARRGHFNGGNFPNIDANCYRNCNPQTNSAMRICMRRCCTRGRCITRG